VEAADVVVIGGGVAVTNAVRMAMGMEARVTVLDRSLDRLRELDMQFGPTLNTIYSTVDAVERHVLEADLVVGAVLVPGAAAPKLVSAEMVRAMRRGAVLVDIAIDQGGAVLKPPIPRPMTRRPTSSMRSCITASRTCLLPSPAPQRRRSTTRPCPLFWLWPTRGAVSHCRRMCIFAPA
jgi:D-arabinose 1-dehydrogenase-like Zn-dependent alcohol dehydrogenase